MEDDEEEIPPHSKEIEALESGLILPAEMRASPLSPDDDLDIWEGWLKQNPPDLQTAVVNDWKGWLSQQEKETEDNKRLLEYLKQRWRALKDPEDPGYIKAYLALEKERLAFADVLKANFFPTERDPGKELIEMGAAREKAAHALQRRIINWMRRMESVEQKAQQKAPSTEELLDWSDWLRRQNKIENWNERVEQYQMRRDMFMEQFNDPSSENYSPGLDALSTEESAWKNKLEEDFLPEVEREIRETKRKKRTSLTLSKGEIASALSRSGKKAGARVEEIHQRWDQEREERLRQRLTPDEVTLRDFQLHISDVKRLEGEIKGLEKGIKTLKLRRSELRSELRSLSERTEAERSRRKNITMELDQLKKEQLYGDTGDIPEAEQTLSERRKELKEVQAFIKNNKAKAVEARSRHEKTEEEKRQRKSRFQELTQAVDALNEAYATDEQSITHAEAELTRQIDIQLDHLSMPTLSRDLPSQQMREFRQQIIRLDELSAYLLASLSTTAISECWEKIVKKIDTRLQQTQEQLHLLQQQYVLETQKFFDQFSNVHNQNKFEMRQSLATLTIFDAGGSKEPWRFIQELAYVNRRASDLESEGKFHEASEIKLGDELAGTNGDAADRTYLHHESKVVMRGLQDLLQEFEEVNLLRIGALMQAQLLIAIHARQISSEPYEQELPKALGKRVMQFGAQALSAMTGGSRPWETDFRKLNSSIESYESEIQDSYFVIAQTRNMAAKRKGHPIQTSLWRDISLSPILFDGAESSVVERDEEAKGKRRALLETLHSLDDEDEDVEQTAAKLPRLIEKMRIERMPRRIELLELLRQQYFHQQVQAELRYRLANSEQDQNKMKKELLSNRYQLIQVQRKVQGLLKDMTKDLNAAVEAVSNILLKIVTRPLPVEGTANEFDDLIKMGTRLRGSLIHEINSIKMCVSKLKPIQFSEEIRATMGQVTQEMNRWKKRLKKLEGDLKTIQKERREVDLLGRVVFKKDSEQELAQLDRREMKALKEKNQLEEKLFLAAIKLSSAMNRLCHDDRQWRHEHLNALGKKINEFVGQDITAQDEHLQDTCNTLTKQTRLFWEGLRDNRNALLQDVGRLNPEDIRELARQVDDLEKLQLHLEIAVSADSKQMMDVGEEINGLRKKIEEDLNGFLEDIQQRLCPAVAQVARETQSPLLMGEVQSLQRRCMDADQLAERQESLQSAWDKARDERKSEDSVDRETLHNEYQLIRSRTMADERRYHELLGQLNIDVSPERQKQIISERKRIAKIMQQERIEMRRLLPEIAMDLTRERKEKTSQTNKILEEAERAKKKNTDQTIHDPRLVELQRALESLEKESKEVEKVRASFLQMENPEMADLPEKYDIAEIYGEENIREIRKGDRLQRVAKELSHHAFIVRLTEPNDDIGSQPYVVVKKGHLSILGRTVEEFQEGSGFPFTVNVKNKELEDAGRSTVEVAGWKKNTLEHSSR